MHINAHLDVDLVAVEQTDHLTLMLELQAPAAPQDAERLPSAVQVVLDRSGSMAGEPLEAALDALVKLVDRLDPADRFGLVTFDHEVDVVVPAGPVLDKPALKAAIRGVYAGGSTNLSGGLLRGLQEAKRVKTPTGATVLLLSDGHANDGITDPDRLAQVANRAQVTVSTIGIGLGYDEALMAAIAQGGNGDHVFAEEIDQAAAAVASQVDGLLSKTVQAASLTIRPTGDVAGVTLYNDLPAHVADGHITVELGDLYAGEQRKLLLGLAVPAMPGLGLANVAALELRYVALPRLVEEVVTLPVHVNVVPGDQAAGRMKNARVEQEKLFQEAQQAKRRAADAILRGDDDEAAHHLRAAAAPMGDFDLSEHEVMLSMALEIEDGSSARAAKSLRMDESNKRRRRGREV